MNELAHTPEIVVQYIDGPQIGRAWSDIYEMIAPACGIALTPADIYAAIDADKALAWVIIEGGKATACAVTQDREKSGRRWLEVVTLGRAKDAPAHGMKRWAITLQASLERHMRDMGQERMRALCSPGLERLILRALGWRHAKTMMEWQSNG